MNAFSKRKATAFRTAVAVPATLLIGLGGTALAASPALADSAPADSSTAATTATAPADPAATATADPTSTSAVGGTATAPATAPASPVVTSAPAPAPKPGSRASGLGVANPTDLTLTSPVSENDFDEVDLHDPRQFTITGTAPIGSKLVVTDTDGNEIAHLTTTSTTFSIPVSFTAEDGYDQYISVFGTSGTKELTEWDFEAVFVDTPKSPAPTITSPTGSVTYRTTYAPLLGQPLDVIEVTGTGEAGDAIGIDYSQTDDEGDSLDITFFDGTTVAVDGTWTVDALVPDFGDFTLSAVQAKVNDQGDETTQESDLSNSVDTTFDKTPGTVDPPEITSPSYGDGDLSSLFDSNRSAIQQQLSHPARTQAAKTPAATARRTELASPRAAAPFADRPLSSITGILGLGVASDSGDQSIDPDIAADGIQVKGKADSAKPGLLDFTVSGTGTPGDDIVLDAEDGDAAIVYLTDLYPSFFQKLINGPTPLTPVSSTPVNPAVKTTGGSSGDPEATASLPADDGSIVVKADGTWSTTLSRKPGDYLITAFAVDQSAHYSVAGQAAAVHLTGDPAVAPAATDELAFTGSQHSFGIAIGGLAAVVVGGALLFLSRRRRAL